MAGTTMCLSKTALAALAALTALPPGVVMLSVLLDVDLLAR